MTRNTRILVLGAAVTLFVSACGEESAPVETTGQSLKGVEDDGRVRVSKTHYSYPLAKGVETPELVHEGSITWKYLGQAEYAFSPEPHAPREIIIDDAPVPFEAQVLGSTRIDEHHRLWLAVDVDAREAMAMEHNYNDEVKELFGAEPMFEKQGLVKPASREVRDLERGIWTPTSWTRTDCDSDGDNDLFRWNADSRSESSDPMTTRQRKILRLTTGVGLCSATMVDSRWLLTAAHCVTDASGTPVNINSIDACTLGNYQTGASCFGALSMTIASGWSGSGMNNDYAVIRLDGSPGVGWMAISQASNSTLESHDSYNAGYPGSSKAPGCGSTFEPRVNWPLGASTQYWSRGDLFKATSNRVKTRIDVAKGHSGGPFYYYPGGCCGAHYITGVAAAHMNVAIGSDYNGGPKGPAIRSWVITNTP